MSDIAIRVENLSKLYQIGAKQERYKTLRDSLSDAVIAPYRRLRLALKHSNTRTSECPNTIWALKDVSFEIKRGEVVGIIGRNGAGKSTLLKILSRITEPTSGRAVIHGRVGSLLEVGTGFHPELTGRENIYLNGAILGMRRAEIDRKFDEIVAFAEVEKFIDTPVKHYSSGMYLRLAFSVAAHLEPNILLVDEVLAVGDAEFQKKCLGKMGSVAEEGRTVLFVSHNMGALRSLCNKGLLLDAGEVRSLEKIGATIERYYRMIGVYGFSEPQKTEDDPHSRFGPIFLEGTNGNTVNNTENIVVSTSFRLGETKDGFILDFVLLDNSGDRVLLLRNDLPVLPEDFRNSDILSVRLCLPPLHLSPGIYTLYFKLFFYGNTLSKWQKSDFYPLDVNGNAPIVSSLLNPPARWDLQPGRRNEQRS